jgi:transcriptional regulator with XRE-family HTH domain
MDNFERRAYAHLRLIGHRLLALREQFGISRQALADELGITEHHVEELESGLFEPALVLFQVCIYFWSHHQIYIPWIMRLVEDELIFTPKYTYELAEVQEKREESRLADLRRESIIEEMMEKLKKEGLFYENKGERE